MHVHDLDNIFLMHILRSTSTFLADCMIHGRACNGENGNFSKFFLGEVTASIAEIFNALRG